jgi:hypothetical protein
MWRSDSWKRPHFFLHPGNGQVSVAKSASLDSASSRTEEELVEESSSKDSVEADCDGWAVAAGRIDRSCYTPKWAGREHEIFDTVYLTGVPTFGGECCGGIAACKLDGRAQAFSD